MDKFDWKDLGLYKENRAGAYSHFWNKWMNLHLIKSYQSEDDKLFGIECGYNSYQTPMKCYIYSLKDECKMIKEVATIPSHFNRSDYGTYYDMTHECLYLIGGNGCSYAVNKYDINKDRWFDSSTIFEHNQYPIAWKDGFILYIAGDKGKFGTVECLDTRMDESHWILANKELQIDKILPLCALKQLYCNNIY